MGAGLQSLLILKVRQYYTLAEDGGGLVINPATSRVNVTHSDELPAAAVEGRGNQCRSSSRPRSRKLLFIPS